jgi:hypothetical protein
MKLTKSLLLASAAGLVAVSGAQAADLGVKKPSAVEYVKTCPTYGAGFFVVPGTTSCLKIVGRVRVDYIFNNATSRTADKNVFRARGYLGFDHRTATEYGLLRTYVRAFVQRDNGASTHTNVTGVVGAAGHAVNLEYGFIQFGGLTVGRVTPVFENGYDLANSFAAGGITTGAIGGAASIVYVNSIGYTANFGGGFSATVSLDSANERRLGTVGGVNSGQAMPDVVAALAYTAAWGEVSLKGALHQSRASVGGIGKEFNKLGYALQLAGKVNLPFLAKGSNLWLSGAMSEGASSYAGWGLGAQTVGGVVFTPSDAAIVGGALRLTKAVGVAGGIQAFVTPTVWVGLTGTYGQLDPAGFGNTIKTASVAGTVGWQPVAGFLIGGEVVYRSASYGTALKPALIGLDKSDVTGRIRFQRDF